MSLAYRFDSLSPTSLDQWDLCGQINIQGGEETSSSEEKDVIKRGRNVIERERDASSAEERKSFRHYGNLLAHLSRMEGNFSGRICVHFVSRGV
ncbi:hypothetical protein Bpfe_030557 [Biomphalaria pfeifferi]|uniref:Uncharacterized protein n=1 Tax=Biomphalaria pfeifferi TaxID=112525 RepID=A0AAD8EUM1_BIOPF|nr:hypothetical protein Bpfe_030557 [Biomphalaria pfeifferi]